jgi:maleylacetoacetate isomerase
MRDEMLRLYTYFRSSAAYRVRIALNLKQLDYTSEFVHLVKNGGQQHSQSYQAINPQKLIPCLGVDDSNVLTQSLAIIEYLEEVHPTPPLLPTEAILRAQVRAFALSICCDIHPLNNLRVHAYLKDNLSINEDARLAWYQHWILQGFQALETRLQKSHGDYCFGDIPTLADICLIPQVYNAHRFKCNLDDFPLINKINAHCLTLDAFQNAAPEAQPDYE